ncbi:glycosyltransferase family 4 protein [Amycolatopsis suaedae]|uniref:Glycosyltransferase n=1 Tax=Amycolatopsis suaedae TaxID=2510978 RepID=A0A4Q7J2X8_9PSEU|nr:glycosyltransferase family 4 protein [Amycolatopsis suaedae]RZQ61287.1 glycosyltransferase [Amycolatopsis suaedae]
MTSRPTVVVAIHDGFYGCGTGAGYANLGFLEALILLLPRNVRLVVMPVWLSEAGAERHPEWHAEARLLLDGVDADVLPVDNGTAGQDRWGGLAHFRVLCAHTARRLREEVLPTAGPLLVIAFDIPFCGLPAELPPDVRARTVLVPRSSGILHTPWDRPRIGWEKASLHAAIAGGTRIGAVSDYMDTHLRAAYGVPRRAMVPLRDGLSHREWQRYRQRGRSPAFTNLPAEFLLAMGRAQPYKGFDDLLDALALLRAENTPVPSLVLAASDESATITDYQQKLEDRLRELDIPATMLHRFSPRVADLLGHPGLRGVVVPSRVEPFGRIPLEAFAAGAAPVVATTAGGLAEQVTDGVTGFQCAPDSPVHLADAIRRALALDDTGRTRMRRLGFHRAVRTHDQVDTVRCFLAHAAPWLDLPDPDDRLRLLGSTAPPRPAGSPVSTVPPVKVPIGLQARHWNTIQPQRLVLVVAHHVTSLLRLLDVVTVFDSDPRVQVLFSWNGSDPFRHGLHSFLDQLGVVTIPWHQAIDTRFDLAIAANFGGLTELNAPIVILPHGAGYAKYSPGTRNPEPGTRNPEPGTRNPEPGTRNPFGFGPEWLLYDGRPVADSLVLSHDDQLLLLRKATPAALPTAVIAGDPCFDRMLRSAHLRDSYRAALGVQPGQKLITITSTWSTRSLLGSWPSLFRETLAGLDAETYRVCALLHPNIWHGHGPWQVHTWLADCVRAGLIVVPPTEGWQAPLIAADLILGDHGATTCYGAAVGTKVVLAAFPDTDVVPGSAAGVLGDTADRLHRHAPLNTQIANALAGDPVAGDRVAAVLSSCPGETATRLRALFYRHLRLDEPSGAALVPPIAPDVIAVPPRQQATADHVVCTIRTDDVEAARYPAEITGTGAIEAQWDTGCLVVHEDHAQQELVTKAAVVLVSGDSDLTQARRRHPAATLLATAAPGDCEILVRDRWRVRLRTDTPALAAAVVHTWLATRGDLDTLPARFTVTTGSRVLLADSVTVRRLV